MYIQREKGREREREREKLDLSADPQFVNSCFPFPDYFEVWESGKCAGNFTTRMGRVFNYYYVTVNVRKPTGFISTISRTSNASPICFVSETLDRIC